MTTSALLVRPAIITPALLLRFVSIIGSAVSFYLPLAVLPLFADAAGAHAAAGLATGALLVATVACELVTPRLVALVGYRWALAIGLFLLGAPALVLLAWSSPLALVTVSVVRGAGFAICVVAGGALTAALIPDARLATVSNAGHLAAGDNPESTVSLIRAFLVELGNGHTV